jgi:hypothetical protein
MLHRYALALMMLLPFSSAVHGTCLPTLGTEDCPRMWDPRVQAIEHKYLDAPLYEERLKHARSSRHQRVDK